MLPQHVHFLFFFNDTATTEIYTLSLHDALPISGKHRIKVALPGYRTFETEVGLLAGQKSEVKTELLKGSIEQASSEVKNREGLVLAREDTSPGREEWCLWTWLGSPCAASPGVPQTPWAEGGRVQPPDS